MADRWCYRCDDGKLAEADGKLVSERLDPSQPGSARIPASRSISKLARRSDPQVERTSELGHQSHPVTRRSDDTLGKPLAAKPGPRLFAVASRVWRQEQT